MKLLALDTSSDACSVAVLADGDVSVDHRVEPREHTRILVPMIRGQLAAAGLDVERLDAIVLGNGPGSFIGMRIGASVAQGLAFGAGLPLVPVSSLAAIAAEVFATSDADRVVVTQDARMGEVYFADYRRGEKNLPIAHGDTVLRKAGEARLPAGATGAGAGWQRYPELGDRLAPDAVIQAIAWPNARYLLEIGRYGFAAGEAIDPALLEPEYVRQTVASVPAR